MISYTSCVYIIDEKFRLLQVNPFTRLLFPNVELGQKCHKTFLNRDTPCPDCPLVKNTKENNTLFFNPYSQEWVSAHFSNYVLDGKNCYLVLAKQLSKKYASHFEKIPLVDAFDYIEKEKKHNSVLEAL